jgi:ribonuclease HII
MTRATAKPAAKLTCTARHERSLRRLGFALIAGVDEVGRGALFGPVVAAAVILPTAALAKLSRAGLNDSKQLRRPDRERLAILVRSLATAVSIAEIDAATIDAINIYQATRRAMLHAVRALSPAPDHLLIDAMRLDHPCPQTCLIHGDALSLSIAAASVVAKVHRDALMCSYDLEFPAYGLASHMGYGTPRHRAALIQHGPTPLHRHTFAPVAALLAPRTPKPQRLSLPVADEPSPAPSPTTPPAPESAH